MASQYEVYVVRYRLTLADPDMPSPRYHTTVLVKTEADDSGIVHHVTGDIASLSGMRYENKKVQDPEKSESFYSMELLGVTDAAKHPHEWEAVLKQVPAPPRQKAFNKDTMRTEPFKTLNPLTFYEPGEPRQPLIKCTEWTLQRAIPALRAAGLIRAK